MAPRGEHDGFVLHPKSRGLSPRDRFRGPGAGRYIDIGGGRPVADNVSFWFYERGWQGIVVEPQPALAALYSRLRPRDIVVEALVGRTNGERDFFLVERLHGFSTTLEQHARKPKPSAPAFASCGCRR